MRAAAKPTVSIVVPVFNKWEYTAKCLETLVRSTTGHPYEVIVVDNASSDGTRQGLAGWPSVRVVRNAVNRGFAKACNQGARMALGKYLLFLNNDTEPHPGWLEPLVRILDEEPEVAIVGSRLLFPDGTLQHAGVEIASAAPLPVSPQHIAYRQPASRSTERLELEAVTGACFIIRPEAFFAAGGFDEGYVNGCEDIDLCFAVREAGWRVVYTPESTLVHHESVSDGRFLYVSENMVRFHERWMHRYPGFEAPAGGTPGDGRDPAGAPVSIVLVAGDALSNIAPCLEGLVRCAGPRDEIVVVDDASADGTSRFVASFAPRLPGSVRVIRTPRAEGFARAANLGLAASSHEYVLLLRPEAVPTPGCLDRLVAHLEREPSAAAAGPLSDRVEGPQKAPLAGHELGFDRGEAVAASLARRFDGRCEEVGYLGDFCLLARRSALAEAGSLDPEIGSACHDLDLSHRLRAQGHRLLVARDAFVRHFGAHRLRDRNAVKREYLRRQSVELLHEKRHRAAGERVPVAEEIRGPEGFAPLAGRVSVVVVVEGSVAVARQCVEHLFRHTHRDFELVLVDAGTAPGVDALVEELRRAHGSLALVDGGTGEGHAAAANRGLAAATGQVVVLLSEDALVTPGWLARQLALLSLDPRLGIVAPRASGAAGPQAVEAPDYADLEGMERFAAGWAAAHAGELALVPRVAGPCLVLRRQVLETIGGMDPLYGDGLHREDDFCLRAQRAGFRIAIAGDAFVHGYGSAPGRSTSPLRALESGRLFRSRWELTGDPRDGYSAEGLVAARAFDPARDRVPLDHREACCPASPPLDLGEAREVRLLCIPDLAAPAWRETLAAYVRTFGPSDPVSLVLRVEPPLPELVEAVVAEAQACLGAAGVAEGELPDVVIEASSIPSAARGGLYTAASVFLPVAGVRARLYLREAATCGVPIVDPTSPGRLREAVAALSASAGEPALAAAR